jgi:hypothetical protein
LGSVPIEPLLEVEANLKCVIVCIATFSSLGRLIPDIFLYFGNMMTDDDRSSNLRHGGCKEPPFPFSKTLNRDGAKAATGPRSSGLVKNMLEMILFHVNRFPTQRAP